MEDRGGVDDALADLADLEPTEEELQAVDGEEAEPANVQYDQEYGQFAEEGTQPTLLASFNGGNTLLPDDVDDDDDVLMTGGANGVDDVVNTNGTSAAAAGGGGATPPSSPRVELMSSPIAYGRGGGSGDVQVTPPSSPRADMMSSPINYGLLSSPGATPARRNVRFQDNRSPPSTQQRATASGLLSGNIPSTAHTLVTTEVEQNFIWGTNIDVHIAMEQYHSFLTEVIDQNTGDEKYMGLMERAVHTKVCSIAVDGADIYEFNTLLYKQLVMYPQEMIPILDVVANEIIRDKWPQEDDDLDEDAGPRLQVRPYNLRERRLLRVLNPADIDQLVSLRGMVIRASQVIPDLKTAYFVCQLCQHATSIDIQRGRIAEPCVCGNEQCKGKNSYQLIHNRCAFSDRQLVRLQETPDSIPEGEIPQTVTLVGFDDMVDSVKPGDRIEVTGIYRASPVRSNPRMRSLKSIYRTYIDVIHYGRIERGRLGHATDDPDNDDEHDENDIGGIIDHVQREKDEELRRLSESPDLYRRLASALAPSIWELDDIKKGVLCQMFGGTAKKFSQETTGKIRAEINVLLIGDPGTSKSQLLQYVHKIAPRGVYTSGKGASAVGLTAYITKDPDTGHHVLESGALVLSDRGICCIDEFDKMSDQTRSILHEAMEQQTVSVAKAGIICTLNARTSILASANPVQSRYNPRMSVVDNIDLPPTLLSRFDLIYLVLDKPNQATDRQLAKHIVALYYKDATKKTSENIPVQTLTDYIKYARKKCHPVISDAAKEDLINGYVNMRKLGGHKKTITATPRQLESLIRLSEAHARMRLSKTVDPADVAEAMRLMRVAMQQAAIDPHTGTIDMDLIITGRSAAARGQLAHLTQAVRNVITCHTSASLRFDEVMSALEANSTVEINPAHVMEGLRQLVDEEVIVITDARSRNPTITRL